MSRAPQLHIAPATLVALILAAPSPCASAHSFGQTYILPIPVWMYIYGAAAALALSFLLVGYFVNSESGNANRREFDLSRIRVAGPRTRRHIIGLLQLLSIGVLALTVAAGFVGTDNPYRNINMTLFWVIFCLGFTYLTALTGDWFSILNPFRLLVDTIERTAPGIFRARYQYPEALGYWPALLLYIAFIWIELFGHTTPHSLSIALSIYIAINVLGCWLVGRSAWFQRCEFFGVFLGLIALVAPVRFDNQRDAAAPGLYLRQPCIGLDQEKGIPLSLLVFVLFMISSTAFDGLKETALWASVFWKNLYGLVIIPLVGNTSQISYQTIAKLFSIYQSAVLVLSPFIYLAVYAVFVGAAKAITPDAVSTKRLLLSFGLCLVPIALAYHFTHYYTLLYVQGAELVRLVSDPFGIGWNLFGTALQPSKVVPDLAVVWHVQVFVIVFGHVVSVYLAHMQALRIFPDRRTALLSQIPTLLLMVAFTSFGLWILSLPLETGVTFR